MEDKHAELDKANPVPRSPMSFIHLGTKSSLSSDKSTPWLESS